MPPRTIASNTLFYGDNLGILREHIADESIDLVYLDPPFNSSRNYNVLFRDESGQDSEAQITAFEDTWHWGPEPEHSYHKLVTEAPDRVSRVIGALRLIVGETTPMMAYLVMMAARLVELHRVLKPTGTLYLHCDTTASHYLKVMLDTIFSPQHFRNEISWRRSNPKSHGSTNFPNVRDIILRYSKTDKPTFNKIFGEHNPEYVAKSYKNVDESGRRYQLLPLLNPNDNRPNLTYEFLGVTRVWRWTRERMEKAYADGLIIQQRPGGVPWYKLYLDQSQGRTITNDWNDIQQVSTAEALGYPTQKPLALLERIITTSSNPGDVVLDPFCGCGTTIAAAQKLRRTWIGIDITSLSIALQKTRLKDMFADIQYSVIGEPTDLTSAHALAQEKDGRYQFQWWALSLIPARPLGGEAGSKTGKKGADRGIDGVITFIDDATGKPKRVLVQVKSGHVRAGDIRDLRGTIEREGAAIGVFITLELPSRDMLTEAAAAGFYRSAGWGRDFPKIQILTIGELLSGAEVKMPPAHGTFKTAARVQADPAADQFPLDFLD